jgi:Asp-tRNAAsn/Glu-tRNAGln amidotransferase A subunit and related amidases
MNYFVTEIDRSGSVAVDDTLLVKGFETRAGSHILDGFVPLFSADAVERLEKAGYALRGKTRTGEFGLDIAGETSYHGVVRKADGTLSTAAAEAVASGEATYALCVDVNGAPRRGAALSGVAFMKPTYGTVSRYGIIPTACSGEQVGVCAANAEGVKEILSVIAGHDPKDGTSLPAPKYEYAADKETAGLKIALVKELYDAADDDVKAVLDKYTAKLQSAGSVVEEISVPDVKACAVAWQIMLSAETCNNISRYDGVKFGYRTPSYKDIDELYVNSRTEGMGFAAKMNVLYGSFVLSKNQYMKRYDKSLRIRRVASDKMKEIFAAFDAVLCPAMSALSLGEYDLAETFERTEKELLFTTVPSLTGIPALVTGGVQLWGPAFGESTLLSIASATERMAD